MHKTGFDPRDLDQAALNETLESLSDYLIPKRRLKIRGTRLGDGRFGTVSVAELRSSSLIPFLGAPTIVAVKELRIGGIAVPLRISVRIARQIKIWASCQHNHILAFTGYYLTSDVSTAYLVSPYMKNGNIQAYLATTKLSIEERLKMAGDILEGLCYLHGREPPVVHGDLKPTNVLVNDGGDVVLSDLGLAHAMADQVGHCGTSTGFRGTFWYSSPEVLIGRPGGRESDIWSWACLALEVLTGNRPFHEYSSETSVLWRLCADADHRITPEPSDMPSFSFDILPLLRECWNFEPRQRPGTTECRNKLENVRLGPNGVDLLT